MRRFRLLGRLRIVKFSINTQQFFCDDLDCGDGSEASSDKDVAAIPWYAWPCAYHGNTTDCNIQRLISWTLDSFPCAKTLLFCYTILHQSHKSFTATKSVSCFKMPQSPLIMLFSYLRTSLLRAYRIQKASAQDSASSSIDMEQFVLNAGDKSQLDGPLGLWVDVQGLQKRVTGG